MSLTWKKWNFYYYTQIWDFIISVWIDMKKFYISYKWVTKQITKEQFVTAFWFDATTENDIEFYFEKI